MTRQESTSITGSTREGSPQRTKCRGLTWVFLLFEFFRPDSRTKSTISQLTCGHRDFRHVEFFAQLGPASQTLAALALSPLASHNWPYYNA